ncbi:MAG: DUF3892 domain-containing protein [Candidatus Margulisiibacteriota bacterium]
MNIILRVVSEPTEKELFVDENLKIYNKEDIVSLIKKQRIGNLTVAKRNGKIFIRSKPNIKIRDNISHNTISHNELISFYKKYSKAASDKKIERYLGVRSKREKGALIVRDDAGDFISTKTRADIKAHIRKYRDIIIKAAHEQKIDPIILGAILIDEYCRAGYDDWLDWLGALGLKDTSVGVAQIKLSTAREIIKKRYYNPAPGKIVANSPPSLIWFYLFQPIHSIRFAAAVIRISIDYWKAKKIDISKRNDVLAYLYSAGYSKNIKKAKTKRCRQISTEYYETAKSMLY